MPELLLSFVLAFQLFPGPGTPHTTSVVGGWGATPIDHVSAAGVGDSSLVTTTALHCTGADTYFLAISQYSEFDNPVLTGYDTGSGLVTMSTRTGWAAEASPTSTAIFYATGITGAANVTFQSTTRYGPIFAACWHGGAATSMFDQESASGTVTCYPCSPSLTPSANDTLVLAIGSSISGTTTIAASGYTVLDSRNEVPTASIGGALLYRVLSGGSGSAQSPTFSNGQAGTVKMANFKHQ